MKLQKKLIASSILMDCCTIVSTLETRPNALAFKEIVARRKNVRLVVPDIVISEFAKVASMTVEAAEQAVRAFSSQGNGTVVRIEDDQKTLADAIVLSLRYECCHYPDSIYLAQARKADAVLVTHDRKMRDVAKLEGIMACSPDNFRFSQ